MKTILTEIRSGESETQVFGVEAEHITIDWDDIGFSYQYAMERRLEVHESNLPSDKKDAIVSLINEVWGED